VHLCSISADNYKKNLVNNEKIAQFGKYGKTLPKNILLCEFVRVSNQTVTQRILYFYKVQGNKLCMRHTYIYVHL
jgi:hypothetical protein